MHATEPSLESVIRPGWPVDLLATLSPLWQGPGDPQMRLAFGTAERAMVTSEGPASIRLVQRGAEVNAQAWGPGASMALQEIPKLLGASDQPELLMPKDRLVRELARRHAGLRLTRSDRVMGALLPAILGQKVTSSEARRSYRELVLRLGDPAPGPLGLRLEPRPAVLAVQPDWVFHRAGVERRRADTIRRAAVVAGRLEEIVALGASEGRRRLLSLSGIGEWTAAETLRPALGDPDAVSVGDFHVPNLVCWLLAGEPRGDDRRMLELLEPYRGQRARVVLLLEQSGLRPPRYGPRMAPRSFRQI